MRRALAIAAVSILAWFALHARGETRHTDGVAIERVLHDLARDNAWITYRTERDGIAARLEQQGLARFTAARGTVTLATSTWELEIAAEHVTEVVCEREHIHWPEPGHVLLDVVFRSGPGDEDDHAPELLRVRFQQASEAAFMQLCDRHQLRKIGDFAR